MLIQAAKFIRNMKLIVISNRTNIENEHQILSSLFDNGLNYFHLRKPDFSLNEMDCYLQQIPNDYLNRIIIHSHYSLADEYKLKGKHKQASLDNNEENFISTSFHSIEEITNCATKYEYAFLSPIHNSISKREYKANFDKKELKQFLSTYTKNIELIALGGINEKNITESMELGFDGVALLGAIWQSKNILDTFKTIQKTIV